MDGEDTRELTGEESHAEQGRMKAYPRESLCS